jgi:integrase
MTPVLEEVGAGEGNRTLVISLEVRCCTISRPFFPQPQAPEVAGIFVPAYGPECSRNFRAVHRVTLPRRYPNGATVVPTKKLTDLFVERIKPPAQGRVEYFDAAFGGLALRVTEGGHKSWSLHYRFGGRLRRLTIGDARWIKPVQARREAAAALERVRQGVDPSVEKRLRRLAPAPGADTFAVMLEDYLKRHAFVNTAAGTYKETKRAFERDVLPEWGNLPVSTITRAHAISLIDGIAAKGAKVHANRTLSRLRHLFNWAVERGRLSASPIVGMKPPTKERARDRTLSDDELRWFWSACETIGWPFGPLAKLLLLTAQRRDEVGGMEWSEINFDKKTWTIPRHRAKNDRAHEMHLSAAALEILRTLPRVSGWPVFTTNGRPVSGFSQGKDRLDAAMLVAKRAELGNRAEAIPHWILHDLRRTAATGMARLNITPHVVDKVLNHVSGTIRGVAAVYNRFEYLEERRAALEALGAYVESFIRPTSTNVITFSAR